MKIALIHPEGATPLNPDEIAGLRHKHLETQGQLDELEQANITSGLQWLARTRHKDVLSVEFAIELHRRLFGDVWDWAGTFRRTGKNIGIDPVYIGIELQSLMNDVTYWVKRETYSPMEAAARLHHRMVFIHPFPNGNGRHARIFADATLSRIYGVSTIDWAGGFDLQRMNERRSAYIDALKAADRHDIGPLLAFVGAS